MTKWNIDPDHVAGGFTAKHMMVTPVHGQFNKVMGMIDFDPAEPALASVEIEVDVVSIYTGVGRRDNHP